MLDSLKVRSQRKLELIDITPQVREQVTRQGMVDGTVLVYTPHTTAGITVNENADPAVRRDIEEYLRRNIPEEAYFDHAEGNASAHIMSSLVSASETFIIEGGRLVLGTWQGIFFCEFDGPRQRQVWLKFCRCNPGE